MPGVENLEQDEARRGRKRDLFDVRVQVGLGGELMRAGFELDPSEGAPLCRWVVEGVKVETETSSSIGPRRPFQLNWFPSIHCLLNNVIKDQPMRHYCRATVSGHCNRQMAVCPKGKNP